MTLRTLILRSLRFHWRAHLGVLLGAAVGSAALIGALVVGDSVRGSLRDQALERLGSIRFLLAGKDRTFTDALGGRMPRNLMDDWRESRSGRGTDMWVWFSGGPGTVLLLPGTAARPGGEARANHVSVFGIWQLPPEERSNHYYDFWNYAGWFDAPGIVPGEVWLNAALARQLAVATGDSVILRLHKPSALSADTPISPRGGNAVALRLRVGRVLEPGQLANFNLYASPAVPLNAFVNLRELQTALDLPGRANLLVTGGVIEERDTGLFTSAKEKLRDHGGGLGRWLSEKLPSPSAHYRPAAEAQADFQAALAEQVTLADYEASLRWAPGSNEVELISRRVFLDPPLVRAALTQTTNEIFVPVGDQDFPREGVTPPDVSNAVPLLTYLANLLRAGTNATPYSMVTAAGPPWTPADLHDDEILVSQWLADDLRVKPGDTVDLTYFLPESGARLTEATNRFRVRAIVPMEMPWADRTLMPEFPGLEKAESTADWDTAFPLVHKIRPKDERYWKQHRGTPKAFVTLTAGQKMWGNRFGNLTAIRFPVPTNDVAQASQPAGSAGIPARSELAAGMPPEPAAKDGRATVTAEEYRAALEKKILATLKPEDVGLRFEPVREQALRAADQSQDFGQLFLGFSFFLIAAALLLMALLFQLGVEQRGREVGTLLALGFRPRQIRRLLLSEGVALAALGAVLGALGGVGYAQAMLFGLATLWRDAVGASALQFHATAGSVASGIVASVAAAAVAIGLTLRGLAKRPARELLAGEGQSPKSNAGKWSGWVAGAALAGALGMTAWAVARGETADAETFFSAGALLLVASLAFVSAWLSRAGQASRPGGRGRNACPTLGSLALSGCARRRKRSLATAGVLACGCFLIVSIGVFRLDANRDATRRSSGTGGFALLGEATLPVVKDLNTKAGRESFGLGERELAGVSVVPFRVHDGDEASCLNLNRAQQPRLLGVKPELLAGRFTFAQAAAGLDRDKGWKLLKAERGSGDAEPPSTAHRPSAIPNSDEIPAIGDLNSILWALGKNVGDTLDFTDERGRPFKVRLVGAVANSILQGSLIIDEAQFVKRFPDESGHRFFLIDAPTNATAQVSAALSRALEDYGLEVTPAARRLAAFNAVQNTYLGTFQVLGGLGLLLGSAGLGIVVLRNVLERRGELAVLLAVGFRRRTLRRLVLSEHAALLAVGLGAGGVSAAVAVLPSLLSPAAQLPWVSLALTLAGVWANGVGWTWLATRYALRGSLLEALRNE